LHSFARRFNSDEVPDPYYGGADGFEQVLDLVEDACEGLLADIRQRLNQHAKETP
jgi:protein-tyrosine phosphatase